MSAVRQLITSTHLNGGELRAQARAKELVSAEGRDAHKAAEVHQVDALKVVQRQLVVEQLRELYQLAVVHRLTGAHLPGRKAQGFASRVYIPWFVRSSDSY